MTTTANEPRKGNGFTGAAAAQLAVALGSLVTDVDKPIGNWAPECFVASLALLVGCLLFARRRPGHRWATGAWQTAALATVLFGLVWAGELSSPEARNRGFLAANLPAVAAAQTSLLPLSADQRRLLALESALNSGENSRELSAADAALADQDARFREAAILLMYRSRDSMLKEMALEETLRAKGGGGSIHFLVPGDRPNALGLALLTSSLIVTGVRSNAKDFDGYVDGTNHRFTGQVSSQGLTIIIPLVVNGKLANVTISTPIDVDGNLTGIARAADGSASPVSIPLV